MEKNLPQEAVLAEGRAQALAPLADALHAKGIDARIVLAPGANPNH
ncbi:MAG: hypothetical protein MK209_08160 [Planctomycetes bacterium]|nr:hypothetical protein [Planctomycetota bacterium]